MGKTRLFCLLFSLSAFVAVLLSYPGIIYAQEDIIKTDRLIVKWKLPLTSQERLKLHRDLQVSKISTIAGLEVEILRTDIGKAEEAVARLKQDPLVVYAEPDYIATVLETTNDPGLPLQWGMYKIKAADTNTSGWNFSKSDPSVKIAILDTGIDQNHEDVSGKIVDNKNCSDSPTFDDLYGHGTHVAGIAAASTNNGIGVAGLGYNASLMNVKVLDDSGSGYYSWIASCIIWAADNGARVINMSLGGGAKSKTLENAVNYAWNKGVVIAAAAGNSGNSSPTYPAYYTNVIAVAATDQNDKKASWSSYGSRWVDVAAPGVSIYSTFPNHPYAINKKPGYDYASGTSMATPYVSGLSALVWSTQYGTNNSAVRYQIESTADKISGTGKYWIYGRINALKAVSNQVAVAPKLTPLSRFSQF